MLAEIQRQAVRQQAAGHAADGEPHAVESVFGSPGVGVGVTAAAAPAGIFTVVSAMTFLVVVEDPFVEEVSEDVAYVTYVMC